jgi:regulator of protease activity HflC (stomatin/prohibitin superfamily)
MLIGFLCGLLVYFIFRCVISGFYTVDQNERAVIVSFGRAERIKGVTTLQDPIAKDFRADEAERYVYPQLRVIQSGGPYFKWPWERVHKVSVATETLNMAYDPDSPTANQGGTVLDAVTKDQLNIGLTGQIRYRVCESNLYAYLFGVKNPISHIMGYFISVLREKIANFEAPGSNEVPAGGDPDISRAHAVSINDLRKNLRDINDRMVEECRNSAARYGVTLDASLITGIDPPQEVESALAAINTAHNNVSAEISRARAAADQTIVQSKRAVEIETLKAKAEVEPLIALAKELQELKKSGDTALKSYVRNVRLGLYAKAGKMFLNT